MSCPETIIPFAVSLFVPSDRITGTPFFQYFATELLAPELSDPATYTSLPTTIMELAYAYVVPFERSTATPFFQYFAFSVVAFAQVPDIYTSEPDTAMPVAN